MTTPDLLRSSWYLDPFAGLMVGLTIGIYLVWGMWLNMTGRHQGLASALWNRKLSFLLLGLFTLILALASPVSVLANGYLFSAHMLQHLLLLLIVPPLILLSLTGSTADPLAPPAAPARQRGESDGERARGRGMLASIQRWRTPLFWAAGVGAMYLWHEPHLCNAATTSAPVHYLQVISLLALGAMFWWPIVGPSSAQRISPMAGMAYLISACLACTLLGIFITFSPVSVCPIYLHPADHLGVMNLLRQDWGLTPLVDQQIGGLMMWVPACMVYLSGVLGLLMRWYASEEDEAALVRRPGLPVNPPQAAAGQEAH